jgi:hypothetical protein
MNLDNLRVVLEHNSITFDLDDTGIDLDSINTPRDLAAILVAWLECRGATFTLRADDTFHCDANALKLEAGTADQLSSAVLTLRDDIQSILKARAVSH